MNYICGKRFKQQGIDGSFNIPATSNLICENNVLYYEGRKVCIDRSENGKNYFAPNYDEKGLYRYHLIESIKDALASKSALWEIVWSDDVCKKYKGGPDKDYWLWDDNFYKADIDTLEYIANILKIKI